MRTRGTWPAPLVLAALVLVTVDTVDAQSLRGSQRSILRMYRHAVSSGLYFYKTPTGVTRAAERGTFERLAPNDDYTLHTSVRWPYVRPETRVFVERLSAQYRAACGEQLVVTSATRPKTRQPANASRRSVHPAGIALDLRKSRNPSCLSWIRRTLLSLERAGVIEATEEWRPPHFHIAVFPGPYRRYVTRLTGESPLTATGSERYRVRTGDSLWKIAQRYDTTVGRLRELNGLEGTSLRPGQTLLVPVPGR